MLRYLISVTESLIQTGILMGMLYACMIHAFGKRGWQALTVGSVSALVCAAVMAYMKNATNRINTGMWNLRTFTLSLIALLVFLLFSLKPLRAKMGEPADRIRRISAAVLGFTFLFYALPDVLANPFTFSLNGESVFSTAFFYRLIGWFLGLILCVLLALAVERSARRMDPKTASALLYAVLLINAFLQLSKMLRTMLARRMIPSTHTLFEIAKFSANYSNLFIYATMLVTVVIPLVLWVRSFHVNEPYENPAQRRKIRARWRGVRRWTGVMLVCFLLGVLNLTVVSAYSNRPVELSPVEDCEIRDDALYVPLEQVDDGHLHRFAWTTEHNLTVRFIIIKKPNSSTYGIGLDACDICGETGYFERNGQVICKLCDVVMNINTIGFKGGCNPIPISYSVSGGYIIVPFSTLVEHENEFK